MLVIRYSLKKRNTQRIPPTNTFIGLYRTDDDKNEVICNKGSNSPPTKKAVYNKKINEETEHPV